VVPVFFLRAGTDVAVIDDSGPLVVRVSRAPFIVFGVLWGGLSLLGFAAAMKEPSFLPAAVAMLGACAGFILWLSRYSLEVTDGILTYRTLFTGRRSLPVTDIARLRAVSGYERMKDETKPFFRLVVEPRAGTPHEDLSINLNVFKREDLEQFKQFLS
jgi:hypothetical protein